MASDPYKILGVERGASQDDIQKAYRALAKKLHPDLNPGDKGVEDKFKELSAAYGIVGDAEKRARFDRGEIDESGNERPPRHFYRDYAEEPSPYQSEAGYSDFLDEDELASIFARAGRANMRMRGADLRYALTLDFLDAVNGGRKQLTLSDGAIVDVDIPAGAREGQVLRLRGKGRPGIGGGPAGDALIEIAVRAHPFFKRDGDDIHLELPISLREAVLGGEVRAPTPTGAVIMTVPKWTNTGAVLRLKGKGVSRSDGGKGDEFVTLKVMLPQKPDAALEKFAAEWSVSDDPRQTMGA